MRSNSSQLFNLEIEKINKKGSKIIKKFEPETGEDHFTDPTTNKKAKFYIAKYEKEIIYIGITKQSIANRLRSGLNPNTKNGYYGYKWRFLKKVDLMVWCDSGHDKPSKDKLEKDVLDSETIEAEIAYLFRKDKGYWPKYQTEIHFHNAKIGRAHV